MHVTHDLAPSIALPGEDDGLRAESRALRFLVDAGAVLARSLDLEITLARAAAVPVPALAGWCVVYLVDVEGRLERRGGVAASRRGEVLMRDALARRSIAPEADGAIARVAGTGLTEVVRHDATSPEGSLARMDPALAQLDEALGAVTSLVLPLQTKGRSLGALLLTDAGRRGGYGAPSIRLAEELAHLAAQVIDNAQCHALLRNAVRAPADARPTILLVDDDAGVREALRRMLERLGYRVLEAWSGRHALHVARAYDAPIDLVLTDCIMPELDGRACAEQLRVRRAGIEVMYMSGHSPQDISRLGVDISDGPFLPKPFTSDLLAWKVRAVLESSTRN